MLLSTEGNDIEDERQKMYKYILFDFDGTVFDTVEGITKSVRYAINKRGMDAPLDSLRCFAGPPLVDMYMEHFGGTPEEADQFVRDFRERYQPIGLYECRIFPGITELLTELRAAGRLEIKSKDLGDIVLEHLRGLDDVAYIRFASVYKDFQTVEEFREALEGLQ